MSHFFVMVVVNAKRPTEVKPEVTRLLEPYNENTEVKPYMTKCYCVGLQAKRDAEDQAAKKAGGVESFRKTFKAKYPLPNGTDEWDLDADQNEARQALWTEHLQPYLKAEAEFLASHPKKNAPDEACIECKGTGEYETTRNPKARWDWWVIGGRWDGEIQENRRTSEGGFNFGPQHHQLKHNTMPVKALLGSDSDNWVPYAFVTPDGEWHSRGRMGWFGTSHDETMTLKQWRDHVRLALRDYPDATAVGVDCHI